MQAVVVAEWLTGAAAEQVHAKYKQHLHNTAGGFKCPTGSHICYVSFSFFSYLFLIVANVGIAVLVFVDKSLHQPMYILFCNLSINDLFGNSIMIPRLLVDMLRPPSERLISYYECVVQAFTTHMFSTTAHTVLMIGLTLRPGRCRTLIKSPYCDNAALFNLSFEDVFINNVYGLTFTVLLFTGSIGSMVLTYTKITVVCLTTKNKSLILLSLQLHHSKSEAMWTPSGSLCL
ncbi:olfactory receptor 1500-like [Maylandia zebra]|uniref:olfactory receptor 1500-like n=1 Tax=Maylandia zebra TaxID=106582 RepID=UPI00403CC3F6